MRKVTAYFTREQDGVRQLLVMQEQGFEQLGWQVPGGTVEAGEGLEQALLREIEEEAGLTDVQIVAYLGEKSYVLGGKKITRHYFHLECANCPDTFTHTVTGTGKDKGWVYHYSWIDLQPGVLPKLYRFLGACLERL